MSVINEEKTNKGTGAGGANTNYYGKKFEEKTNNQIRLLEMGYTKHSFTKKAYYLSKTFEDKNNCVCITKCAKNVYEK